MQGFAQQNDRIVKGSGEIVGLVSKKECLSASDTKNA